jgi:pyruvate formate lyase activating enzyme
VNPADPSSTGSSRHATVLNIQRMSTEDGPGIRTTVFFKGCTLACDWCHNPESIDARPETVWHSERCIGCHTCDDVCVHGGLVRGAGGIDIDRTTCQRCGGCADECPALALEQLGTRWALDDLVHEVAKDRPYFARSGGGVTASGGEPAVQADFVTAFLAACRETGLHTVLDTCGVASADALLAMAHQADLVLYDLKLVDDEVHRAHTGAGNGRVLDNLRALAADPEAGELWIRTPLIPGITATGDNVGAIARLLRDELGGRVARWELCAFNNLCQHKYERLGRSWSYRGEPLMTRGELDRLGEVAREAGLDIDVVQVTGMARRES